MLVSSEGGPAIILGLVSAEDDGARASSVSVDLRQEPVVRPAPAFSDEEIRELRGSADRLHERTEAIKTRLRAAASSFAVRAILTPELQSSFRELEAMENMFLGRSSDTHNDNADAKRDRDQDLKIVFDDLKITYKEAAKSLGTQLIADDSIHPTLQTVFYQQRDGRFSDSKTASLEQDALRPIEDNEAVYSRLVDSGNTTFDLTVFSSPPGASIQYKRRGDDFKPYPGVTTAMIQSLPLAIWIIHIEMDGYTPQDIEYDPFRTRESSVSVTLRPRDK